MYAKMQQTVVLLMSGLCLFFNFSQNLHAAADSSGLYTITPEPGWVEPVAVDHYAEVNKEAQNGRHYLLLDKQVDYRDKLAGRQFYLHYASRLTSTTGVEHGSIIDINFDPTYEVVKLHNVTVTRGEQSIDKLASADIQVLQKESGSDALIYDGQHTVNIILNDVRPGDIVEYSYTVAGENPVFNGQRELSFAVNWGVPVEKLAYRVLTEAAAPLTVNTENTNLSMQTRTEEGFNEYTLNTGKISPVTHDQDIPGWSSRRGRIYMTDIPEWNAVARWATDLFRQPGMDKLESGDPQSGDPRIKQIAADINSAYPSDREKIGAALQWVQNNIRYLGIEFGTNSHRPSPPSLVMDRRFGDCKDKSMLLITLLSELGITAQPVLANTYSELNHDDGHRRLHAFDHALVHVRLDNQSHWLDPTLSYQRGALGEFHEPDYGKALIVDEKTTTLTDMSNAHVVSKKTINKVFTIPVDNSEPALLKVDSIFRGLNAGYMRDTLLNTSHPSLQNDYTSYYSRNYGEAEPVEELAYQDFANNTIKVSENYRLLDLWHKDSDGINYSFIWGDEISSSLDVPEDIASRTDPYEVSHPQTIEENIVLQMPAVPDSKNDSFSEDNDFFSFHKTYASDAGNNTISVRYQYSSKTDHVPADKLEQYSALLDILNDQLSTEIAGNGQNLPVLTTNVLSVTASRFIFLGLMSVVVLIYLYAIAERLSERFSTKPVPEGHFYPVSQKKFLLMFVFTLGMYQLYWMYRNFQYLRRQDNLGQRLVPGFKALFGIFFYYQLLQAIRDALQKNGQLHRYTSTVVAILSLLYLAINLWTGNSRYFALMFLLPALLLLPAVRSIKRLNVRNPGAFQWNSRLRPRHYAMAVGTPLFLAWLLASNINLLALDTAIAGDRMWDFQRDYLVSNDIIAENEDIVLLYSDAPMDIRSNGVGFTAKQLFSYWVDDKGNLNWLNAPLDAINSIDYDASGPAPDVAIAQLKDNQKIEFSLPAPKTGGKEFVQRLRTMMSVTAAHVTEASQEI